LIRNRDTYRSADHWMGVAVDTKHCRYFVDMETMTVQDNAINVWIKVERPKLEPGVYLSENCVRHRPGAGHHRRPHHRLHGETPRGGPQTRQRQPRAGGAAPHVHPRHPGGELATRPHIAQLAEDNAREGFLEPADFATLGARLAAWLADVAIFAYLTGWRKGEVVTLTWADVDLRSVVIRLPAAHSKNKRPRVVILRGELRALLERRAAARRLDCPLVFHRDGQPVRDFRTAWRAACEAAGLTGQLFHDMRRSAIRNIVRAGVPERVAMAVSGHRTRSPAERGGECQALPGGGPRESSAQQLRES
jgi:hypothetical protein